jgi:hypothetical protein
MAFDEDGTERETVPLPDTEAADGDLTSTAEPEGDVDSIAIARSHGGTEPGDEPGDESGREARDESGHEPEDGPEDELGDEPGAADEAENRRPAAPSGRSKGLIAAAVAGVLVIGGAVAATVGGGSGKGSDKSAAPTAGLVGQQVPSSSGDDDGDYASGATSDSPWVWQTGQQTAKYPGATTGSGSSAGAPKPTGSGSGSGSNSGPGSQSSGPGLTQRSSTAPGAPSAPMSSAAGPATPPRSAPPATFTLVAGPGCPGLAGSGGYSSVGSGASSGWGGNGSGGWGGDGCDGSMQSMPMTGDASNGPNRAVWSFGSGTSQAASCVVSVYVPWDGKATDTGGTAADYQVAEGPSDTTVADFTVNQNAIHGKWTTLGTVNVGGASVKLRLLDHGVDYPAGWRYGISAAKVQCTA